MKEGMYCELCHKHHNPWRRLVRTFVMAFVILLVLLVGLGLGRRAAMFGYGSRMMTENGNMMWLNKAVPGGPSMMYFNSGTPPPTVNIGGMMQNKIPVPAGTRIAGLITKIEDSKITLTDNGGGTQVVFADAQTVITTSSNTEISVSSLKAKEFVVCYTSMKNGKVTASTIKVQ